VVRVVGMSGLGKPLTGEFVHRTEIFSTHSHLRPGEIISPDAIIRTLLLSDNMRDRFPPQARRIILLNQADSFELQAAAKGMAKELLFKYQSVIVASLAQEKILAVHEPVAGIILAAGESTRYGQPKQLLDWHGEPFVRVVARKAVESGMTPVVLVTGAHAEEVGNSVADLGVQIIKNEDLKSGQAGSIKSGLQYLDRHSSQFNDVGACIFLLVDQPHITPSILQALMEKHAEGLSPILAPMVIDRRANPVLFDRVTFQDLLTLEGDMGGRGIFHKHRVEYLPWHDDRLLLDVDTPEQYQRLIADETL
jgi:molybdenum cofactor cytidylyltransferase